MPPWWHSDDALQLPMPSQGSQWTILAENFVKYVLHDERAKRWLNAFERRLVPDESLLQTIMMHSPFKQSLINHNLRWIYWPHQATNNTNNDNIRLRRRTVPLISRPRARTATRSSTGRRSATRLATTSAGRGASSSLSCRPSSHRRTCSHVNSTRASTPTSSRCAPHNRVLFT